MRSPFLQGTFCFLFFASPLATTASEPITDSQLVNPNPAPCCTCLTLLDIHGNEVDPQTPPTVLNLENGAGTATVFIRHNGGTTCTEELTITVSARSAYSELSEIHPTTHNIILQPDTTSQPLNFVFTADQLRMSSSWEIYFKCDEVTTGTTSTDSGSSDDSCPPPLKVTLKGCTACSETCELTAETTVTPTGHIDIQTPTNPGDARGELRYTPGGLGGSGQLSNRGPSALTANTPLGFAVAKTDNQITGVTTGNTQIDVLPADATILAYDPNAFVITHTVVGAIAPFRRTTISLVDVDGIKILRTDSEFDGTITRHEQSQPAPGIRIHDEGRVTSQGFQSLRREIITTTEAVPGTQIERRTVKERPGTGMLWDNAPVVSDVETTREKQIKGWVTTKEIIDPDGEALTSTWAYYPPGEATGPGASAKGLGRLKHYVRHDGYEEFYTYELYKTTVKSPYAGDPDGKTTITQWKSGSAASIKTTSTFVNGVLLSTTTTTHSTNSQVQTVTTSQGQTLTTSTFYKPSGQDFGGKPTRIIHPDGTLTTYDYERLPSGGYITTMDKGSGANGVVTQGIRTITTVTSRGTTILEQTQAIGYDGTQDKDFGTVAVTALDFIGRALTTAHHPASITIDGETIIAVDPAWTTSVTYSCCGVATETDRTGIVTQHTYDHLKRRVKSTRLGVTTETVYQGLTTETHRYPAGQSASAATLVSRSVRNLAGTLQESWTPDPSSSDPEELVATTTATTYAPAADLSSRTVTTVPGGHTQTTDSFLDGRTATTYGDLSPAMVYHYSVNSTGELSTQAYLVGTEHREITGTQTDRAGRTVRTGRLASLESTAFMSSASMHYNSKGQLVRTVDPDGIVTLMAYNAKGERTTTATDLEPNTTYNDEINNIEYGTDTVQFSETVPALSGGNPVWQTTSKVWQDATPQNPNGIETVVSTSLRSADGLSASSTSIGVANPSTSVNTLQGSGNWTTTQTNPDNTFGIATYVDGRMVSSAMFAAGANPEVDAPIVATSQAYDDWNRPTETTDSRTGTTVTEYMSATNDAVKSVTDPGNRKTEFVYDNRGRQIKTILPDDSETLTTYNPRGEVTGRSGSQTYPVTYTYDYAGRQKTMTTYGTEEATTTWIYDPATGFLVEKNYDGETDNGDESDADYTYTAAGRLLSRTWERGVTTTYGYDAGGRLISTTYSDNTPDVSITYDALGRQLTQSNSVAKSTFAYNAGNLQINTETIQYDLDPATPGYEFTRILDRTQDTLGRDAGWKIGTLAQYNANWEDGNQNPDQENAVAYGYSTTDGRLASVSGGGLQPPSQFNYTYTPNSNLLASITGPIHTVTNTWEPTRNVLELKENKVGTLPISSFNYGVVDNTGGVNEIGQRTSVRTAGTAFSGASSWSWAYDPLGQITLAEHGTNTNFNRAYEYDNIGNRQRAAVGTLNVNDASATLYTANALNQYSQITNNSITNNPEYDSDGNMSSGPLPTAPSSASSLAWDAENRLISATIGTTTVTYTYDSQSRRIATQIGSTTTLVTYDAWNPIAEWSADLQSATLTKTYTWGMDLSGSMQGAGGVGGLLMVSLITNNSITNTFYPTYDGNGNVSEYLDNIGTIVAHYEYDPFGRVIVESGDQFASFAHRFSTKPQDLTTGLLYYGYRWYDPVTGRWPSRDPIEERGGINLYGFVGNDGIRLIDFLGMWAIYDYFNSRETGSFSITGLLDHLEFDDKSKTIISIFLPDLFSLDYKVHRWTGYSSDGSSIEHALSMNPLPDSGILCGCVSVAFKPTVALPIAKLKEKVVKLLKLESLEDYIHVDASFSGNFLVADCVLLTSHREVVIDLADITLNFTLKIGTGQGFVDSNKHLSGLSIEFELKGKPDLNEDGLGIQFEIVKPNNDGGNVRIPIPFTEP